jgi:hypothetical protein
MKRKPDLAEHIERFRSRGVGAREKADANRAADPEMAAWLDDMRSRFGATLTRVEWPDGRTWGAKPEKWRTLNATEWLDYLNDPEPRALG